MTGGTGVAYRDNNCDSFCVLLKLTTPQHLSRHDSTHADLVKGVSSRLQVGVSYDDRHCIYGVTVDVDGAISQMNVDRRNKTDAVGASLTIETQRGVEWRRSAAWCFIER